MLDAVYDRWDRRVTRTRNEAIIALLYDTGLRRQECALLDVEQLDVATSTLRLPSSIQKGNAPEATLTLGKWGADSTRSLRRWLDELEDVDRDGSALFPTRRSDRITPKSVTRSVVKPAARAAGVSPYLAGAEGRGEPSDVSAHTLRHSVAWRIIHVEGGRLEDVQARLRHAERATTDRIYSHIRPR
jgi:integrase